MKMLTTDRERLPEAVTYHFKKKLLAIAITLTIGTATSTASAGLSSGDTLNFVLGTVQTVACTYGTTPPCSKSFYNITDIVGSYFAFDTNANGIDPNEKTRIESFRGIVIGESQLASGSHSGLVNGSESPDIDLPWNFFGNTGMHQTIAPVTVLSGSGNTQTLDMSVWNVTWNGIPSIPMVPTGDAVVTCDTNCSNGENFTLDAAFHTNGAGFTTVPYSLHLEGVISGPGEPLPPTKGVSIQLTGGRSQECSSTGGSSIEATAEIRTNDTNDIAAVTWELDGAGAGSGNSVNVFTPLGNHTLSVVVDTLVSGSFQSSEPVTVRDRTAPELEIRFIDHRTGGEITEVAGNGAHHVTVRYDVTDVCDPEATASGVAVPVHAIDDGDVIKIKEKKLSTAKLGTSAVSVSADATDASGNRRHREATLLITD